MYPPPYPGQQPPQQIDFQKIISSFTTADWLIIGGALVTFIATFFPWYSVSYTFLGSTSSASADGWQSWPGVLTGLISLATLVWIGIRVGGVKVELPLTDRVLYLTVGAVVAALSLLYLAQTPSLGLNISGFSSGPSIGLFLSVLAGIAIAVGGYLKPNTPTTPTP